MKVYLLAIDKITDYQQYLKLVTKTRLNKIQTAQSKKFIITQILTDVLVRFALKAEGYSVLDLELNYDLSGRPNYNLDCCVSISHSNNFIAVVVSKRLVGIDIQQIKPKHLKLIDRVLDEQERKDFALSPNQIIEFYRYWTAKEAAYKTSEKNAINYHDYTVAGNKIHFASNVKQVASIQYLDYVITLVTNQEESIELINFSKDLLS